TGEARGNGYFQGRRSAGPRGGVVTQRSAKPCTPVQFRAWPPILSGIHHRHFTVRFTVCVHALPRSSLAIAASASVPVRARYLSRMVPTSRIECPVMAAISAALHSASASRVTAVPRRSCNVRSVMLALRVASPHALRKRFACHAMPRLLVRITVAVRGVFSSTARRRRVTGMLTERPVLLWRRRIQLPSKADHGSSKRSPCRVAGQEFGRTRYADKPGTFAPSVVVGGDLAGRELHLDAMDTLKMNSHFAFPLLAKHRAHCSGCSDLRCGQS